MTAGVHTYRYELPGVDGGWYLVVARSREEADGLARRNRKAKGWPDLTWARVTVFPNKGELGENASGGPR